MTTVIMSRSARILSALGAMVMFATATTTFSAGSVTDGLRGVVIVVFLCLGLYVAFWRPTLIIGETGVVVINPFTVHAVDWGAIERIDTKWGLTLHTARGGISVWAAPAPGRHAAFTASRDQGQHLPESTYVAGTIRPGDLVTSESGGAAAIVRREWESHSTGAGRVDTRVAWSLVAVFIASALAAIGAVVF